MKQQIQHGKERMPSFGYLTPADIDAVLKYICGLEDAAAARDGASNSTGIGDSHQRVADAAGGIGDSHQRQKAGAGDSPLPVGDSPLPVGDSPIRWFNHSGYTRFVDKDGYPAIQPPWGTLTAIDLNKGEHVWQVPLGYNPELAEAGLTNTGTENYGGPLVIASGLIFIAASKDAHLRAIDERTGKTLWEGKLPFAGYATPCTYMIKGRQYVVIAAAGGKLGTLAGDAYVAFALPKAWAR